jgi:hypothetical protein
MASVGSDLENVLLTPRERGGVVAASPVRLSP